MIRRVLLPLAAALLLAACSTPRSRAGSAFVGHFAGTHRTPNVEILETIPRTMPDGERRFLIVGAVANKERGGWDMVWAEMGLIGDRHYGALRQPATPERHVDTWDQARTAAIHIRKALEDEWAASAP